MSQLPFNKSKEDSLIVSRFKNFLSIWKVKKYPSFSQFRQFLRILTKKEKTAFFVFLALFLASFFSLFLILYFKNTRIVPSQGGVFVEGINTAISRPPRFINPIYANSDTDRDLTELIYSGLMKYDKEGKIIVDLAERYEIKNDGKAYEVYLKKDLLWSDGKPLTADDVIFTIKTIQNSDYKSPQIANWLGVEAEKISDLGVRFTLKNPYSPFLENLTQRIIPQHIWKDIGSENFPLTTYNLKAIGSGPYKIKEFKQNKDGEIISLELTRNQRYAGKTPYLLAISFRFFYADNKTDPVKAAKEIENNLIKAAKKKEIQGFSVLDPSVYQQLKESGFQNISLSLPRYFAVFFNPEKSEVLNNPNVRQALNYGVDKNELIEKALLGYGKIISSPVLPEIYGLTEPTESYSFNSDLAKNILEESGFTERENGIREKNIKKESPFQFKINLKEGVTGKDVEALQQCLAKDPAIYPEARITGEFGSQTKTAVIRFQEKYAKDILEPFGLTEGTGEVLKATRDKLNQICFPKPSETLSLKFSLVTVNQPFLIETANLLKEQWKKLGVEIEIKAYEADSPELKNIIKTRNYESLMYGEILGIIPDPFPFWHSTQRKDPGLNLAAYQNKTADKLLEEIRQASNETERRQKLEQFQNILIKDAPAVFLYTQDYAYLVSKEIKGLAKGIISEPSKRFTGIENWYTNIKRAWRQAQQ